MIEFDETLLALFILPDDIKNEKKIDFEKEIFDFTISFLFLIFQTQTVGSIPGNTVPGIPGNFPKIFIPGRSREYKTIPGNNGNEN